MNYLVAQDKSSLSRNSEPRMIEYTDSEMVEIFTQAERDQLKQGLRIGVNGVYYVDAMVVAKAVL